MKANKSRSRLGTTLSLMYSRLPVPTLVPVCVLKELHGQDTLLIDWNALAGGACGLREEVPLARVVDIHHFKHTRF